MDGSSLLPASFLFHSATMFIPSGLCDGETMMIVWSSTFFIHGELSVAKR